MSNILIIKHGSLGDIAQACGAIQDICNNHKNQNIYILTTKPFFDLFKKLPLIKEVILDKRLSRFNIIYLFFLMKKIKQFNFSKVYDLQNSSRTNFYKRILFPKAGIEFWSSSITSMPEGKTKEEFDKVPVLKRFEHQLNSSGLNTKHTLYPNFEWACENIEEIKKNFNLDKYILLFPFCSPHLILKKWPYYDDLIKIILQNFGDRYKIVTAPGPNEIKEAEKLKANVILNKNKALNISELGSLIKSSSFVIANDTGPAHMAAHLGVKGLTLFGQHTTAEKVSIERENFKAIQVNDLKKLSADKVFERMSKFIV